MIIRPDIFPLCLLIQYLKQLSIYLNIYDLTRRCICIDYLIINILPFILFFFLSFVTTAVRLSYLSSKLRYFCVLAQAFGQGINRKYFVCMFCCCCCCWYFYSYSLLRLLCSACVLFCFFFFSFCLRYSRFLIRSFEPFALIDSISVSVL